MLTVLQRVTQARVEINNQIVGEIGLGLMILCGFEPKDTIEHLKRMLLKCINYRVFDDNHGKMNLSLSDVEGGLLLIPQFTLMADTQKGLRPSFSKAASPEVGRQLFDQLINLAQELYPNTQCGSFGANMQIHLCNDGPVTLLLNF